jgi:hypothetical protein
VKETAKSTVFNVTALAGMVTIRIRKNVLIAAGLGNNDVLSVKGPGRNSFPGSSSPEDTDPFPFSPKEREN